MAQMLEGFNTAVRASLPLETLRSLPRQPASPCALRVLPAEQTPPAIELYLSPVLLDGAFCSPRRNPARPANQWLDLPPEPSDHPIRRCPEVTPRVLMSSSPWPTGRRFKLTHRIRQRRLQYIAVAACVQFGGKLVPLRRLARPFRPLLTACLRRPRRDQLRCVPQPSTGPARVRPELPSEFVSSSFPSARLTDRSVENLELPEDPKMRQKLQMRQMRRKILSPLKSISARQEIPPLPKLEAKSVPFCARSRNSCRPRTGNLRRTWRSPAQSSRVPCSRAPPRAPSPARASRPALAYAQGRK